MSFETPRIIRRADRGLTIAGTRVTLYAVMDYLRAGWSADDVREALPLSAAQIQAAIDYIAAHQVEVDAEYAEVVREAEANRRYWEARSAALLATRPRAPITAEKAALYAKLAEQRGQTIRDLLNEEAPPDPLPRTPRP